MTEEELTFKRAPGERIEEDEYPVLWKGEIGRGIMEIDDQGIYRIVPNEELRKRLSGDISVSKHEEFVEKVKELFIQD